MDYFNNVFGRVYNFVGELIGYNTNYALVGDNINFYTQRESGLENSLFMGRKKREDGKGNSHQHNSAGTIRVRRDGKPFLVSLSLIPKDMTLKEYLIKIVKISPAEASRALKKHRH